MVVMSLEGDGKRLKYGRKVVFWFLSLFLFNTMALLLFD